MADGNAMSIFGVKLKQLQMTCKRTNSVLDSNKDTAIKRQLEALKALTSEVETSRRGVEALKIEQEVNEEEVAAWNSEVETEIEKADDDVKRLEKWLDDCKLEKERNNFEEKLKYEIKLHETKLKLDSEHQVQLEAKLVKENSSSKVEAKLPKLVISKFDGNYMDWQRFWGQFTESIEKSGLASIAKFSYLRELLGDKVKREVESLPFTPEGYNRAKAILEEKYGKESEIVKAYVNKILSLPYISSADAKKIAEFSDQLTYCAQSLQSLDKLSEVKGITMMTLDKLPAIRGDLVRSDAEWELWDLDKLAEALRLWLRRNPVDHNQDEKKRKERERMFLTGRSDRPRGCVYCESTEHKGIECTKVTAMADRKLILAKKRLCFNCALGMHRASQCQSKTSCQRCNKRHHTSICDTAQTDDTRKVVLTPNGVGEGVFPVVLLKVDGIITRALIDTGAGSSYVSAKVGNLLTKKPCDVSTKRVEMLMGSHLTRMKTYNVVVESLDGSFQMDTKLTKVNKNELLTVENPHYEEIKAKYAHLARVHLADDDKKDQLPVHVILSVGDYARIKTDRAPLIGQAGEPVAEYTKLGWFIMSPGSEFDRQTMLLTQTSHVDYEELCRLEMLGLRDSTEHERDMHSVYKHADGKKIDERRRDRDREGRDRERGDRGNRADRDSDRDRDCERCRDRDSERNRQGDLERDGDREAGEGDCEKREREGDRDVETREHEEEREGDRERDGEREAREGDCEKRERERDRDVEAREHEEEREGDRERDGEREAGEGDCEKRERERDRDVETREREEERESERDKYRDGERDRERDGERDCDRDREKEHDCFDSDHRDRYKCERDEDDERNGERKWSKELRKNEKLRRLAEEYKIKWKFNLSRAPWWGGEFEHLIGVVKSPMFKVIRGGYLTWDELSEVMLDIEIQINRRPLSYVEDDIELPTLTPASFLHQRTYELPEEEPWRIDEPGLKKRTKYLIERKNKLWRRWRKQYLVALRERHNMTHKKGKFQPKRGDVVMIQAESKNRGTWPQGIVEETYPGKDNVVRGVRVKTPNGALERAVQPLYPLELSWNAASEAPTLNPDAVEFEPRPRRDAGAAAKIRIKQDAVADQE